MAEHTVYLRKACSYLCTSHLGIDVVHDGAFLDPMQHYENLYAEYLELFCSTLVPPREAQAVSAPALLPLLKHQLNEWRWVVLNPKQGLPQLQRESELRALGQMPALPENRSLVQQFRERVKTWLTAP